MERSEDWFEQAKSDLAHARHAAGGEFYEWACFSAHQAAEKAVKSVFQRMGADAGGHSVADLLKILSERHEAGAQFRQSALELDKAYIPTRYPNAHPSGSPKERYTSEDADRLIQHSERIIRFCESLLSSI